MPITPSCVESVAIPYELLVKFHIFTYWGFFIEKTNFSSKELSAFDALMHGFIPHWPARTNKFLDSDVAINEKRIIVPIIFLFLRAYTFSHWIELLLINWSIILSIDSIRVLSFFWTYRSLLGFRIFVTSIATIPRFPEPLFLERILSNWFEASLILASIFETDEILLHSIQSFLSSIKIPVSESAFTF